MSCAGSRRIIRCSGSRSARTRRVQPGHRRPFAERWMCHALGPLDELKLGGDVDCALEVACDRAEPSVERVHPLSFLSAFLRDREPVAHMDAFDEQHAVLCLDLANRLDLITLGIDLDLTRLQRAGEGARQSTASSGHNVVQCRGVGWVLLRPDAVVLGYLGVHAEHNGRVLGGQKGKTLRAAKTLNPHARNVRNVAHEAEL
jgi:hypothetical protein